LYQTFPNRKHVRQSLAYPDPATGFIHSRVYYFRQLDENIRHNENFIQDLFPK